MNINNKLQPVFLLRLFLGLVFLSAGFYCAFHRQESINEISNLGLGYAYILSPIVILLEVLGGLFIILNIQVKKTLLVFSAFLTFILLWALITSWQSLIGGATVLFTFKNNPTDFFLHFTYLVMIVNLIFNLKISTDKK